MSFLLFSLYLTKDNIHKYNVYLISGTIEDVCQIADRALVKSYCSTVYLAILGLLMSCDARLVIDLEPFTKLSILG